MPAIVNILYAHLGELIKPWRASAHVRENAAMSKNLHDFVRECHGRVERAGTEIADPPVSLVYMGGGRYIKG